MWRTTKKRIVALAVGSTVVLGAAGTLAVVNAAPAAAWSASASAKASCSDGNVVITGSLVNNETTPKGDMNVTMTAAGKSDGPKAVPHGTTGNFSVKTGQTSVSAGTATFGLTWVGRSGSDTRSASYSALNCKPAQPEPKVTYTEWQDGAKSCETSKVTQTRTKTTTPYVWDGSKWVLDTANATSTTETQTRAMTEAELKACTTQPEPKVTYTEWQDGAKSCETSKVTQTRTKTTTPYVWDGSKWVLDTANATSTTETQTRAMTEAELKACTTQPEPKVTYTEWQDGAKSCETSKVTQTRTKTTTPYVWDGSKWILDTANATSTTETQTRAMTEAELKACTTQPEPKVTYTEWQDGAKSCETSKVTQTRTKTTTPYVWDGSKWVLDTANATSTTETQTRAMTEAELKACQPVLNRTGLTCEAATWQVTNTGYIYDAGVTTKPADLPMSVTGPFEFSFDLSGLKPGTEVTFTFHYTLDEKWQSLEETIKVPACTTQPEPKVTYTEWQDGAKSCETSKVTQTRTKTTTPYVWDGSKWVLDTANATSTTETQTRAMTEAELKACTTQPEPKVTYTEWQDGAKSCETSKVTQTRTKTTTPYVWDGSKWVLDTANATSTTETQTRAMTEAELKACQPTKPGTGYPTESPTGDDEGPTAPWANPITWLFGAMVAGLFAFISRRREQDTTTR